jgi:hypothetical protein
MNRLPMSAAASALLRLLIARSGAPRDRILLTDIRTTEWQSLTFTGERHEISLRVPGPSSSQFVERMCDGLEDAEFSIPMAIVADIGVPNKPKYGLDGSISLVVEALTVSND